jgi:PelA/Pel-15E family pectate lyase
MRVTPALAAVLILACRGSRGHTVDPLYPIVPTQSDSLLSAARVAGLPAAQREPWRQYITVSRQNRERDRAFIDAELRALGRARPTPAPAGAGFELQRSMDAAWFRTAAAKQLAAAIVTYQTPSGGWSKGIDFARPRRPGESFASDDSWSWIGTLDNNSTTEQLKFLASAYVAQRDTAHRDAFRRGVEYLLTAQFPNGCWPQVYPLQGGYHDAVTFNDDASIGALQVIRSVARGDFAFVPAELRTRAQVSLDHGIRCLLDTQIVMAGRKLAWGAQHDPLTLVPVAARAYEHAALSGRESATIVDFLMQIERPSKGVVAAVHAAAAWFRAAAINGYTYQPRGVLTAQPGAGPLWARFYELGSNRPIFSDRDGVIRYDLNEIGAERREGYLWYTDEPRSTLRRYDAWSRTHPPTG